MNAIHETVVDCADWVDFTDEELMVESRTFGALRSFEELVRRYRLRLARFFRNRYNLDAEETEEALQATFMRVWEKRDLFDATRAFRPWLYRVASSCAVDAFRRAKRSVSTISLDATRDDDARDASLLSDVEARESDPAVESEFADAARSVREATARLPEESRAVVELVFYQGTTFSEAARKLHIAAATAARRAQRAVQLLCAAASSGRSANVVAWRTHRQAERV